MFVLILVCVFVVSIYFYILNFCIKDNRNILCVWIYIGKLFIDFVRWDKIDNEMIY